MLERLGIEHATIVLDRILSMLNATHLRAPQASEPEEAYVASVAVPIVRRAIAGLDGLTLRGEGLQQAVPVHYLGYNLYPDISIMHYEQRLVAIEAKFVDFARPRGALSTAIGQALIYSRAGYFASIALLIGSHGRDTQRLIDSENTALAAADFRLRLCCPNLRRFDEATQTPQ